MTDSVTARKPLVGYDRAARVALEEAITYRVRMRSWYRGRRLLFAWRDLERENDIELRALLAVRRIARKVARENAVREAAWDARRVRYDAMQDLDRFLVHDPIRLSGGEDWTEAENREAWGR